ncbi:MAG: hypothetical protein AAEJ04_04285, partial [Planctomycetota bacterium]
HVGLADETEDQDYPFQALLDTSDSSMIASYERRWRVQKDLVDRIISIGGASIEELEIDKRQKGRAGSSKRSDDGGVLKFPVSLRASVPASRVGGIVDGLLRHNFIDFEVRHLAMAKDRESLVYNVVEQLEDGSEGLDSEPPVRLLLELDVIEGVANTDTE